jgi:ABC-type arginine transport system ATPase subunit
MQIFLLDIKLLTQKKNGQLKTVTSEFDHLCSTFTKNTKSFIRQVDFASQQYVLPHTHSMLVKASLAKNKACNTLKTA